MDETIKQKDVGPLRLHIDDRDLWIEQKESDGGLDIVIVNAESIVPLIELLNKAKKELENNG